MLPNVDELIEPTTGMRIREARQMAGFQQQELAARLGVTPAALSLIESDRNAVTVERLGEIARLCGRDILWFLPSDRADLAACLRARFPDLTPEAIRSIETYAQFLASPASRVPPRDQSSGR